MKITRMSGLVALVAAGALVLSACGSDDNSKASSAAAAVTSAAGAATSAAGAATSAAGAAVSSGRAAVSSAIAGAADPTFEGSGFTCAEGSLRSSGSTAQGKVMEQWIADFNAKCEREPECLRRRRVR